MSECKQYELDLLDYATGDMTFLTKQKQKKLFSHLRQCRPCRDKFFDYERIYATSATLAQAQNPEFRNRMNRLIEQFKRESVKKMPVIEPIPGEKVLDNEAEIGSAARKLWHYLYGNGKIKVNDLKRKVKLPTDIFYQAVGWLARENQIHRTRVKKSTFVYLAPAEIQKHQAQAQM